MKYNRRTPSQYAIVLPESKLWIGWFDRWVHAWIHFRKLRNEDWFIVRRTRRLKPKGWLQLDEPCELKPLSVNGVYPELPRTRKVKKRAELL